MSLKKLLDDPQSGLRRFLDARLPNTRPVAAEYALATSSVALIEAPNSVPGGDGKGRRYPAAEVGHAFSARVSLLFTDDVDVFWPPSLQLIQQIGHLAEALRTALVKTAGSVGFRTVSEDREQWLVRACYAVGLFDQLHRAGAHPGMPLLELSQTSCLEDLLTLCPSPVVDELITLTGAARGALHPIARSGAATVIAGPPFTGSPDVGGADGDLIVDSTLLELKTTSKLALSKHYIQQVVTYALLDYDDDHHLDSVGVFNPRRACAGHLATGLSTDHAGRTPHRASIAAPRVGGCSAQVEPISVTQRRRTDAYRLVDRTTNGCFNTHIDLVATMVRVAGRGLRHGCSTLRRPGGHGICRSSWRATRASSTDRRGRTTTSAGGRPGRETAGWLARRSRRHRGARTRCRHPLRLAADERSAREVPRVSRTVDTIVPLRCKANRRVEQRGCSARSSVRTLSGWSSNRRGRSLQWRGS